MRDEGGRPAELDRGDDNDDNNDDNEGARCVLGLMTCACTTP